MTVAAVTVILGIGLSLFIFTQRKLAMTEVCIAAYDLPPRTPITEKELTRLKVPEAYLNENVLSEDEIMGKSVRIDSLIPKGSFIYRGAVEETENMKDRISADLKEGEVGYDIYVNDIKVNQSYLLRGIYVDIYLTVNKDRVLSDLLLNNVRIIGLYDIRHNEIKDYDRESVLESICLAVPKDCVSYLNRAAVIGDLSISVGDNIYRDVPTRLNTEGDIFEYLD